eukprot:11829094-Ditylum_brightwellii.AAC.1
MQHLDDILHSFNGDLNVVTNKFCQLLESSRDINPDHNILWPLHGPDLIFPIKQRDKDQDYDILWPWHGQDPVFQLKQVDSPFSFSPDTTTILVWPRHGPDPFVRTLVHAAPSQTWRKHDTSVGIVYIKLPNKGQDMQSLFPFICHHSNTIATHNIFLTSGKFLGNGGVRGIIQHIFSEENFFLPAMSFLDADLINYKTIKHHAQEILTTLCNKWIESDVQ